MPTNVAGFATTSFALRIPTNAMNMPIPAAVECFKQSAMPLTICSRTRVTVSRTARRKKIQRRAPFARGCAFPGKPNT